MIMTRLYSKLITRHYKGNSQLRYHESFFSYPYSKLNKKIRSYLNDKEGFRYQKSISADSHTKYYSKSTLHTKTQRMQPK